MMRSRIATAVIAALTLVAAACGGDDGNEATPADPLSPQPTVATGDEPTSEPAPDEPTAIPTVEATATPEATAEPTPGETPTPIATPTPAETPTPSLPGEPFDLFVPQVGEVVAVVGVAHDDILEVHEVPGENSPLVGELPNLADDVVGQGEGRLLPQSIWWLIEWNGIEGWVGSGFVARLGGTFDITSEIIAENNNSGMGAETMLDLGMMVVDLRFISSIEPEPRIVVSEAPSVNDDFIGEITIDIVGLGDDSVRGERLRIFGDGFDHAGEGFSLDSVEMTIMCSRGVTDDGFCV